MADVSIGNFQVLGNLGSGAHSSILHIRRKADGAQYALKVVSVKGKDERKFLEQARHEFRVAGMLAHPNLIKIHALEIKRNWLFRIRQVHLLIEFVNGQTLNLIPHLSLPRLVQVFAKIAAGLMHMHQRGVFHADIKPNNILLSRTGEVKIIDYGLAWIKGEDKGRVQGTPEYMAPEQAHKGLVDERTDIYNFGATMYRLTTLRLPPSTLVRSGSKSLDAQTFEKQLCPVSECIPQAPRALCKLIHQCLSYRSAGRPGKVSDILEVLNLLVNKMVRQPEDGLDSIEW